MIVPDLNLLLFATNPSAPKFQVASDWWNSCLDRKAEIGFAEVVLTGFLRIATHPRIFPKPVPPKSAAALVRQWLNREHVTLLPTGSDFFEQLLMTVSDLDSHGPDYRYPDRSPRPAAQCCFIYRGFRF